MTKVKFQNFQIFKNPNHNFTKRAFSCFEKIKNQIHDFLVKKHFPEQSSLSCLGKQFVGFVFKYNRGMMRAADPHTTLQIDSTSHNQVWDRIYFFDQFGFGRVLKSTKNPNNDPYDSRTSKEAKRREIQLKFEKVSQYFPSKLLETIPNPLYRVDLVIYGWIR